MCGFISDKFFILFNIHLGSLSLGHYNYAMPCMPNKDPTVNTTVYCTPGYSIEFNDLRPKTDHNCNQH